MSGVLQDPSAHGTSAYSGFAGSGGVTNGSAVSVHAKGAAPAVHYGGLMRKKPTEWDLEVAEMDVRRSKRCGALDALPQDSVFVMCLESTVSWLHHHLLSWLPYGLFRRAMLPGASTQRRMPCTAARGGRCAAQGRVLSMQARAQHLRVAAH
jgi:hypothetical protein